MGIATAIIGSAIVGGISSSRAARKGAQAQVAAADQATAEQRRQYDQTREDWAPWRAAGEGALGRLEDPAANFQSSPGYQFRVNEGNRNTENRFSVKGGGGNAMRALNDYNQNMASNEFGNWWGQQSQLAGMGQNATSATTQAGMNSANNISNNYLSAGNARASGIQNSAAGWNNALQAGIGNWMYGKGKGIV